MNIGFLSFDPKGFDTIRKILQKIREPGALDEIGIGRYRDAFGEELFPGMSTLQHHAKYFVLLPALFNDLAQGSYKSIKDVQDATQNIDGAEATSTVDSSQYIDDWG